MVALTAGKTYLERAFEEDLARLEGESGRERIRYAAADHSARWAHPEEKVRAELWAELLYRYEYPAELIAFEVTAPDRTPERRADLVIYQAAADGGKSPWFVFECKRADVTDAEFNQAVEQAVGNRNLLGATYCGAVAGHTRRFLRFDRFPPGERERNHLTDIPIRYGRPPEWRFLKNEPSREN